LYGVLGSVIAQLWLVATGIVMLRRARVAPDPATTAEGGLDNRRHMASPRRCCHRSSH
jgi:hypothetical protein